MNDRWSPTYTITPASASALMRIEAAKAVVAHTPLTPTAEAKLRERARLRSTHYSTYIEGNRLTLAETEEAVAHRGVNFQGRERDAAEVRHRARTVLTLFARHDTITTAMIAMALGLSPRMARALVAGWIADGWLQPSTAAKKNRTYQLTAIYRQYIGNGYWQGIMRGLWF